MEIIQGKPIRKETLVKYRDDPVYNRILSELCTLVIAKAFTLEELREGVVIIEDCLKEYNFET